MSKFFSYDPLGGFEFHETAEEARAFAEKALQAERDEAPTDGWSDEVEGICWGVVTQRVGEAWRKRREDVPEDEQWEFGEWDELIDYELLPKRTTEPIGKGQV